MTPLRRPLAAAVALLLASALTGCATTKPPSTVPPTGWPDAPAASRSATPSAQPTPSGPAPTASDMTRSVTHDGVTVPLPTGYLDATALVTAAPSSGPTKVIAFLRNPGQHTITVQSAGTDYKTFDTFLAWYVKAWNAGTEASVASQRAVTMGGLPGVELTLKGAADGRLSTEFVAMRAPGVLIRVTGQSATDAQRQAIEAVATGLRIT